ncbi:MULTISPECIES: glycerol-3-phosphate responsive antiterminator [Kosmotoga]|uniref:Glycerol-3-phosphate responsive antiterminator, GlpP n=1 Tax=Kosmotoga olearia (strain ATCC BAA-1733 / DSM 21960 / TBF 19.5.1) TaxID=521045 RepID=C5CIG0_KOSOT|nr:MULTISPECIES: glycerol-3-phosphate responsive antiterminator [Kosmotoga]ACR78894.1 glycerol-3-phosphate responsive antiterminator, GlpP [Kosmotoga olearia TBF 19.5.1]MDK2953628.1 glycerol uptake operon antiterminator [Kosmotoga sp.]OAA24873.1 glycerol-3-phosphate responsive antiterminator GlpP [Kosmotoga sp. DU53]
MLKGIIAALWERTIPPERVPNDTIFFLNGGLLELPERVKRFKESGKRIYVDIDFISGLNSDHDSVQYLKEIGVDGVITAKVRTYKIALSLGIPGLLRFFALDSRAVDRGLEQILHNDVRAVEILPGLAACKVSKKLRGLLPNVNIVAAGLIDNVEELKMIKPYVDAISTSNKELWYQSW